MSGKYSEEFEQLFNFTRKISKMCGVDVISDDYEYNWRTGILFFIINLGVGFSFYTIYVDIFINGTWLPVLVSIAVVATGIQGYVKFVVGTNKILRISIRSMHREIKNIYVEYENKSLDYKTELKSSLLRVKKLLSTVFVVIMLTVCMVFGVPLFMLIVQGKRTFILNIFLPYVDVETTVGYYVTFFIHSVCVFFAGFGTFISDSWVFIYVAHIPLLSNILKCKFHQLDNILETYPHDATKSKPLLLDILKWHQKYNKFSDTIKTTYFWVIFTEIATEFFGIICTILCIFLDLWPAAPVYLIYSFALFYSFCFIGNIVEVANDNVIDYIYDSSWYQLTVPEQKMILTMLANAQQAMGMTIGNVAPLSMNTALQMTKTFYSMSMLLQEFLNN